MSSYIFSFLCLLLKHNMYYIKSLVTWKCIYITSFHCVRASCTSCTRIVYTIYVHRVRAFCQEVNNHWDITLLFSQFSHLNLMTVAEEYLKYFTTKWCVIFDKFKIDNHLHFLYIYTYCTSTLTGSEEHTSELQSRPHISYAVFCLKKKKRKDTKTKKILIFDHHYLTK